MCSLYSKPPSLICAAVCVQSVLKTTLTHLCCLCVVCTKNHPHSLLLLSVYSLYSKPPSLICAAVCSLSSKPPSLICAVVSVQSVLKPHSLTCTAVFVQSVLKNHKPSLVLPFLCSLYSNHPHSLALLSVCSLYSNHKHSLTCAFLLPLHLSLQLGAEFLHDGLSFLFVLALGFLLHLQCAENAAPS